LLPDIRKELTAGKAGTATPSATLNYEWFYNDENSNEGGTSTGVTSATFTIPTTLTAAGSPYYYYCVVSATGAETKTSSVATVTVAKANGAAVSGPPIVSGTPTHDIITVYEIFISEDNPGNQTVEYAKSTTTDEPSDPEDWQPGRTFTGLTAETVYYVFARSKANDNCNAGEAQRSAAIATAASGGSSGAEIITIVTSKSGLVGIGLSGENIVIDWFSDGTEIATFSGTHEDLWPNFSYSSGVERTITISGEKITVFQCYDNELTELDISACASLSVLNVWGNQLTELDVSNNFELSVLYCSGNQLTELDISANTKLIKLGVEDNDFDKDALNALFQSLPAGNTGEIYIGGNLGYDDCNPALAPPSWSVYDYD